MTADQTPMSAIRLYLQRTARLAGTLHRFGFDRLASMFSADSVKKQPDDLFTLHMNAASAFQRNLHEEAGRLMAEALARELVHVEGPLHCYELIIEREGIERAEEYLTLFIAKRSEKIWNDIDTYVDYLRATRYVEYPLAVNIETLALCNAACHFCQYVEIERKGDRMPDDLVVKIINELAEVPSDLPFTITLAGVSEPLLDHRIYDHIALINQKIPHAHVAINTNGAPLTDENIERLTRLNIAWMGVSVNDYRKEEYERSMQIPYDRTIEVLTRLQEKRRTGEISFNVGVTRAGDGSIHDLRFIEWVQQNFPALSRNFSPQFSWVGDAPVIPAPAVGCTHWFDITVRSTGQVAFCCIDGHILHPWGDLRNQHILEVYNSPAYKMLRQSKKTRPQIDYCRNCTSG
jgi:MoaA/NifB/PqqE/SkfB family radical SAM enzyme